MAEITAETLKDKLDQAITKHMLIIKKGKVAATQALANEINVGVRQIYMWKSKKAYPVDADVVMHQTEAFINNLDKPHLHVPALTDGPMTFPFRIVIPKNTLNISKDEEGNMIVQGLLSVDLL